MASPAEARVPNPEKEGANVDKIRDILFGSQMRDYEKRFARLEESVTKALDALRDDTTRRLDTLSGFVQQEVESLSQRIKTEKSERGESVKDLARELKDAAKVLEKKLSALDEQLSDGQSELRAKLLEHSKSFAAELEAPPRSGRFARPGGPGVAARKDRPRCPGRSAGRILAAPEKQFRVAGRIE
jgi:hypothetical protein